METVTRSVNRVFSRVVGLVISVPLRYGARWFLVITLLLCINRGGAAAVLQQISHGCLYATTVGPDLTPVVPCIDADPLNIATDPTVRAIMRAFGIDSTKVRFKGCNRLRFSAAPARLTAGQGQHYIITYPVEVGQSYIAPITHELSHVLQMEMTGSLVALRKTLSSKRIELGADYLTGIVFANFLQTIDRKEFQHNLSLIGLYVEFDEVAHGTPEQRTGAFRFGLHLDFDTVNRNFRTANERFQRDEYGQIIQF